MEKGAKTVLVSVSGGRTSGYMAKMMLDRRDEVSEWLGEKSIRLVFAFANTGMEHPDTLRFLNDMDREWSLDLVWLEGEAQHGKKVSTKHRIVTYESAFRPHQWHDIRHPYHDHVRKYGVKNVHFRGCTREMKTRVIDSYMKSMGLEQSDYYVAIGIRDDERRRVSDSPETRRRKIIYPLVDFEPVDKGDVIDYWAAIPWDLEIPEYLGNCVSCFKKSFLKLMAAHTVFPEAFVFTAAMEKMYGRVGPEFRKDPTARSRVFFRLNNSTSDLLRKFRAGDSKYATELADRSEGGCSEQCEMFPTENID